MITAWIDNRIVVVNYGYTVMQSCALLGIDMPRFCYHDKLLIAGNCRICLVEVYGKKKLVISCSKKIRQNIRIFSNTIRVHLARQGVLEFLLSNHPLDCPICDQGGECDLQDISMLYASDRGRYYEFSKRAVSNKNFGPLIRTSMNRCIHCTRCVRFLKFSTNQYSLGMVGRGFLTEITNYVGNFFDDPLSGNIIDLCPVGALTSKPYSFKVRPWELTALESLDVFDSLVANVTLEVFSNQVYRVLPYLYEAINEDWISNKARFSYDGLFVQRIFSCFFRISLISLFKRTVDRNFSTLAFFVKIPLTSLIFSLGSVFFKFDYLNAGLFLVGSTVDLKTTYVLKSFLTSIALYRTGFLKQFSYLEFCDFDFLYLFNHSLEVLIQIPSLIFLVFLNPRFDVPLLDLKFARLYSEYNLDFFSIGLTGVDLNYAVSNISNAAKTLFEIFEFKHVFCRNFYEFWFANTLPFFLFNGKIFGNLFPTISFFSIFFNFLNVLKRFLELDIFLITSFSQNRLSCYFYNFGVLFSSVNFLHVYEVYKITENLLLLYLLKFLLFSVNVFNRFLIYSVGYNNESLVNYVSVQRDDFLLIYQGSHVCEFLFVSDFIFPTLLYIERSSVFRNLLGFSKFSELSVVGEWSIFSDHEIFIYFHMYLMKNFFDTILCFRFGKLFGDLLDQLVISNFESFLFTEKLQIFGSDPVALFKFMYFFSFVSKFSGLILASSTLLELNFNVLSQAFNINFVDAFFFTSTFNYYSDSSNLVVRASRTMSLCASTYSNSRNFSFPRFNLYF